MTGVVATGIGSGLDIEGLVTQLIEAERAPTENRLLQNEARITASLSAFGQLQGATASLESAFSGLSDASIFDQRTASSSNNSAVVASAETGSLTGSYQLSVDQLARAHSLASLSLASLDDEIGTGTLTIRFGTTDYVGPDPGPESYNSFAVNAETQSLSVDIDATNNSLTGLRDAINQQAGGAVASIVNDGTGYRLLLTSTATGQNQSMEISVSDLDGNNTDSTGLSQFAFSASATHMEQTVAAQDASIQINGIQVSSASNQINSAIEGVSLFINEVTESAVSVQIQENTSAATSSIQQLVNTYNNFVDTIEAVAGYDPESQTGGPLQGDFTVRSLSAQLRQMLSGQVSNSLGDLQYLSQVGLSIQVDGKLTFDTAAYNDAYEQDRDSVIGLFAATGLSNTASIEYLSATAATQTGDYDVNISQPPAQAILAGASLSGPLTVDANNKNFTLDYNGNSLAIELTEGAYASATDFYAEIASKINNNSALEDTGLEVQVAENSDTGVIEIRSVDYGSSMTLELLYADANFVTDFGFTVNDLQTGQDVAGTLGGLLATGAGDRLTGVDGGDTEGLVVRLGSQNTGALGQVSFSSGLMERLSDLLNIYLDEEGTLNSRVENYESQISDIDDQRIRLEERLISLEARYRSQFNALDSQLAQLQSTSDFLTQQLDSLPGPRSTSD